MKVGIDDISLALPTLYVDMDDFADLRNVPSEKIKKGIGLDRMAILDTDQDPATLTATAILKLMTRNGMNGTTLFFRVRVTYIETRGLLSSAPLEPAAKQADRLEHALRLPRRE